MNIKLEERPNKKISKTEQELSIIKNNKTIKVLVKYEKDKTRITCEGKDHFINADEKYKGFSMSWDDKFYKKIEELTGGKIIGCMNCKFFGFTGLMYEQTKGYGGNCLFEGNNKNSRATFEEEPKGAFERKIDGQVRKFTNILSYCPEFILDKI